MFPLPKMSQRIEQIEINITTLNNRDFFKKKIPGRLTD